MNGIFVKFLTFCLRDLMTIHVRSRTTWQVLNVAKQVRVSERVLVVFLSSVLFFFVNLAKNFAQTLLQFAGMVV